MDPDLVDFHCIDAIFLHTFNMQLQTFLSENWDFVRLLLIHPKISCKNKQKGNINALK